MVLLVTNSLIHSSAFLPGFKLAEPSKCAGCSGVCNGGGIDLFISLSIKKANMHIFLNICQYTVCIIVSSKGSG